jgi:hypothetical protein
MRIVRSPRRCVEGSCCIWSLSDARPGHAASRPTQQTAKRHIMTAAYFSGVGQAKFQKNGCGFYGSKMPTRKKRVASVGGGPMIAS